jgi:hypothetical protein
MAFHDYYKLLNLPKSANSTEIKRAYRTIAKKFHPDTNPTEKGADEYFKIVTEGYNILSNSILKEEYDRKLNLVYAKKYSNQSAKYNDNNDERSIENIRKKLILLAKKQRRDVFNFFVKREQILKHSFRYLFIGLFMLLGYLLAFNRWFVDEASMDYLVILIGVLTLILFSYFFVNHLYIHLKVLSYLKPKKKIAFEKISVGLFILLFFMGPSSLPVLNSIKKQYHLNNYAVYIKPYQVNIIPDRIVFVYVAINKMIYKSTTEYDAIEAEYLNKIKVPVVKVSRHNPKIAKLLFMDKHPNYAN